jgi:hypothetical protein
VTDPTYYYGSHPKPGSPDYIYPTHAMIRELLGPWGEMLASYIPQIPLGSIETYSFCNAPPPPTDLTEIGLLSLARMGPVGGGHSLLTLANWVRGQLWPIYCEMDPPPGPDMPPPADPTPAPLPDLPTDTALPPPLEPVEGPDLAAQLAAQLQLIQGAVNQLTWLQDNVQLRTAVLGEPFEITASGWQQHRPAVGYLVQVHTLPSGVGHSDASIPRLFSAGFVSYGRMYGFAKMRWPNWRDNVRVARYYNLIWTDGLLSDCFCWELAPQVQATVIVLEQPTIKVD